MIRACKGGAARGWPGISCFLCRGRGRDRDRLQAVLKENRTVSVPVSIEVYASGAKAEQIGQSVYDTAERGFLRTLKSVTA